MNDHLPVNTHTHAHPHTHTQTRTNTHAHTRTNTHTIHTHSRKFGIEWWYSRNYVKPWSTIGRADLSIYISITVIRKKDEIIMRIL